MNRNTPVTNMTAKPNFDQRKNSLVILPPRNASPSRRRSKITIMPTDKGRARMWLPSITGNSQRDSLIVVARGVCCSHWHHSKRDVEGNTTGLHRFYTETRVFGKGGGSRRKPSL